MKQKKILASENSKYEKRFWIKAINCLSGFKSVNLVATENTSYGSNLCVISSLFHLGANPPLMGFVLRPHSPQSPRHTLINLLENPFFTINHVNDVIYKKAHQTSARYKQEISEFKACDLKEERKDGFAAPFVQEANIQLAMKMLEVQDVKLNGTHIIISQIECIYLPEQSLQKDGFIDLAQAGTVCLSGLDGYYKTEFLNRLSYAKPNLDVSELSIAGDILSKK